MGHPLSVGPAPSFARSQRLSDGTLQPVGHRGHTVRTLNLLALVGVIFFVGTWGIQWARAPWSMASLGPTLTGVWEGPLRTNLGAEYRLFLNLQYRDLRGRISAESTLTGQGRICTRTGEVYEYNLDGEASRSGDSVELRLSYADAAHSELGTQLEGAWNGQTLTLRPRSDPFMPDGSFQPQRPVSGTTPDDSIQPGELRKSDPASFLIACGRLAG
jgi:hypothetical protein